MTIDLDMAVERGRFKARYRATLSDGITGIFGRSGCGKTTLLHLLCGLIRPSAGRLSVHGRVLVDTTRQLFVPPEKRSVGVVFQDLRLFPHLSVRKNLLFAVRGRTPATFGKVVQLLDLEALLDDRPAGLSGGQRQRVALGRTLLQSPDLLLLDEPFSAIDVEMRYHILPYIKRIQELLGIPMLVVSHDLSDLLRLGNTLLIIRDGAVAASGDVFDLARRPEIYSIFRQSRLMNHLALRLAEPPEGGVLRLRLIGDTPFRASRKPVIIEAAAADAPIFLMPTTTVRATLSPSAVAVSKSQVCGISQNNQIRGIIKEVVHHEHNAMCVVDVGVRIFVEITKESFDRLKLARGMVVYCLFKSNALTLFAEGRAADGECRDSMSGTRSACG